MRNLTCFNERQVSSQNKGQNTTDSALRATRQTQRAKLTPRCATWVIADFQIASISQTLRLKKKKILAMVSMSTQSLIEAAHKS